MPRDDISIRKIYFCDVYGINFNTIFCVYIDIGYPWKRVGYLKNLLWIKLNVVFQVVLLNFLQSERVYRSLRQKNQSKLHFNPNRKCEWDLLKQVHGKYVGNTDWFCHGDIGTRYWLCNIKTLCHRKVLCITVPLWGETTGHRWIPLKKDEKLCALIFVVVAVSMNKLLNKNSSCRWFETP